MNQGQSTALEQLEEVAARGSALEVLSVTASDKPEGAIVVEVSVDCRAIPRSQEGLNLRARERFRFSIPAGFPFEHPEVITPHTRFSGFPHVQWGRVLCLYQAPATEWDPSDGMFGFLDRLYQWLEHAAVDQLDPVGAPLHPPVAYRAGGPVHSVIPRANAPAVSEEPWVGLAELYRPSDRRADITGWHPLFTTDISADVAAAILLSSGMPFEFPTKVEELLDAVAARGVSPRSLLLTLQAAVLHNDKEAPLYVVIGAPMRGIRGSSGLQQHLSAWYVEPSIAKGLRLAINKYDDDPAIQALGEEAEKIILEWAKTASVTWCQVREARPEIVTRRDHSSPSSWFAGRSVALWGCGALGGHLAGFLARAGAQRLILHDDGVVSPGILARQPYRDQDLGRTKVHALADQLRAVCPAIEIEVSTDDLLQNPLDGDDWTEGADVLIDTTGSEAVLAKLELRRWSSDITPIPIVAMVVGHEAEQGLVTVAREGYSGGASDTVRRAKIDVCNGRHLSHFADEFWPEGRTPIFQPEPGCSDPTFVGSAADVSGLAGMMFNLAVQSLQDSRREAASAHFIRQPSACDTAPGQSQHSTSLQPDSCFDDPHSKYQIRIAESARADMLGWAQASHRTNGPDAETGGVLFGERDDALGVIWVTEVTGPPPDSEASPEYFLCGVEGTAAANEEKRSRTRRAVQFIGMWHTHPNSAPIPSATDVVGMERLVSATEAAPTRSLLIIVGAPYDDPVIGAHVFSRRDFAKLRAEGVLHRPIAVDLAAPARKESKVGIALSGGGSRAIAFHLGCLRALQDRGVLPQVDVISAVSGGSVIAALYAYSHDSFEEFDRRIVELLRRGLLSRIARWALLSPYLPGSLLTTLTAGAAAAGATVARRVISNAARVVSARNSGTFHWSEAIQAPLRRWWSRTTAFERALSEVLIGGPMLGDERRNGIDVVLNACELRTGTAFRFGSRESACWRFGTVVDNDISVAQAVACSAAYPALLPAVDRTFRFAKRDGVHKARVVLTDGGVFDNLGVTCMEPGRSQKFSSNVFSPEYIVCCDAGPGQFSDTERPFWWPSRMRRSFETTFRKNLNGSYGRLHQFVESGELKGFVLAYLGQQDHRLPWIPPDLVRREEVYGYPTDFSAMSDIDIERIATRGEQLTRLLISQYMPDV